MNKQLSVYFEKVISKFYCAFWKKFSAQIVSVWCMESGNELLIIATISNPFSLIYQILLIASLLIFDCKIECLYNIYLETCAELTSNSQTKNKN